MKSELGFEAMAHLMCNGIDNTDVQSFLNKMQFSNLVNILALRGDLEPGRSNNGEFKRASDLIQSIEANRGFCIGAACYPEGHVESPDRANDLTQLFFENSHYFRFVAEARAEGIGVPIIPGIMPITNAKQLPRVKEMGASVPVALERDVLARADDPQGVAQFGVAWASLQSISLLGGGRSRYLLLHV